MPDTPQFDGLFVVPRCKVQGANCISSPLTWGFPSITAFAGLMWALERRLTEQLPGVPVIFNNIGVVCHAFQPHVTDNGFSYSFNLTRNPLTKKGETAPIIEEGRANMVVSLVLGVQGDILSSSEDEQAKLAQSIGEVLYSMRIAGGSVLPLKRRPYFVALAEDVEERALQFRKVRRRLLPGFALVCRDDLLKKRHNELLEVDDSATPLDAWMDLSRINWRSTISEEIDKNTGEVIERAEWQLDEREGWIVPIPVGYTAISPLYENGEVANTRDDKTPFQFVESIYSMGQWVAPHHFTDASELLWFSDYNDEYGVYRCYNNYKQI